MDDRLHIPHRLSHRSKIVHIAGDGFRPRDAIFGAAIQHPHVMVVAYETFYEGAANHSQAASDKDVHKNPPGGNCFGN